MVWDAVESQKTTQKLYGVQGVASSNPATPTIENQRVSSHKELTRFDFCPIIPPWSRFGPRFVGSLVD